MIGHAVGTPRCGGGDVTAMLVAALGAFAGRDNTVVSTAQIVRTRGYRRV